MASNLRRKGEALAVSGLTEYGDDIDVIAPADILKQIFKIPYSRARLSIAVHRIGQSLILNTGYILSCASLNFLLYLGCSFHPFSYVDSGYILYHCVRTFNRKRC